MKTELALNEYYFICDHSGHYLKTKQLPEFEEVRMWNNLIFNGLVKSNQFIHFKMGKTWKKRLFSSLKISDSIEVGVYDFHLLQTELSSQITKIEIGGKVKAETYEKL